MLLDKPRGPTSHDVVAMVRRRLNIRRVGHAGTLDPFATGLLVGLVGSATRLSRFVSGLDKEYTGSIQLGVTTDTDDDTGAVTSRHSGSLPVTKEIEEAMECLSGSIAQTPPVYSSIKISGRPAHRRVRRGESVVLQPRDVTIHEFKLTERDGPRVDFRARVTSGTYVRALARDLGEKLGCGAHLAALRRTSVGAMVVEDAVPVEDASPEVLREPLSCLAHLASLEIDTDSVENVRHGRPLEADVTDGWVALSHNARLVCVAEASEGRLRPRVVLS